MENLFTGVGICGRKMGHAWKYIDYFISDILDYSVINEESQNFKKQSKIFDIRIAITNVLDIVTD